MCSAYALCMGRKPHDFVNKQLEMKEKEVVNRHRLIPTAKVQQYFYNDRKSRQYDANAFVSLETMIERSPEHVILH
jgi:hypothetical protein